MVDIDASAMHIPDSGRRVSDDAASAESRSPSALDLEYRGTGWEMVGLCIINALLMIVTLGLYRFWARTNVRRHIWSRIYLQAEPLEYTGTGMELFKGFLIALAVIVLPLVGLNFAIAFLWPDNLTLLAGFNQAQALLIFFLLFVASYFGRRYRLQRTQWRGIRGGLTGSAGAYACIAMAFWSLSLLTLMWTKPIAQMTLARRVMNNTQFGGTNFSFAGSARPLYWVFAIVWFMSIGAIVAFVTAYKDDLVAAFGKLIAAFLESGQANVSIVADTAMGTGLLAVIIVFLLSYLIYTVVWLEYYGRCVRFEGLSFRFNVTFVSLLFLVIGNFLISVLSLSILSPIAEMRSIRYFCMRTTIEGEIDIAAIQQNQQALDKTGEGGLDVFDGEIAI